MPIKNTSLVATYFAYDVSTGLPKTGDAANHTIRGFGDGAQYTPAASPAEVDPTNAKGQYKIVIASGENNVDLNEIAGVSLTANVVLIGMVWTNTVPLSVPTNFTALDIELDGTIHTNIDSQVLSSSNIATIVTEIWEKDVVAMGLTGDEAGSILANIGDANDFWGTDVSTGYTGSEAAALINKLNFTGNAASSAEVLAVSNNTSTRLSIPQFFERPDTGSTAFVLDLYVYDTNGNMEAPDSAPTLTVVNEAGTNRAANLGTVTLIATGHYQVTYTVASTHAIEQLRFEWTVIEGGATRIAGQSAWIVDTTAVDFTASDRTTLNGISTTIGVAGVGLTQVTAATVGDKTGYSLAATGLNAISVADPGNVTLMTTLPKMVVALWRLFYKKRTMTSTLLKAFADDNATVNATSSVSDDGTIQTQGAAT